MKLTPEQKAKWLSLKPFTHYKDVPEIPYNQEEPDTTSTFISKCLITAGAIPLAEMKDKQVYLGSHRMTRVARWSKELDMFEYWHMDWGGWVIDTCNHFEMDDACNLFVPLLEIDNKYYVYGLSEELKAELNKPFKARIANV